MRCPACGSDTTPALPRCTRCDAPLNGDASASGGAPPPGDATRRDDGRPSSPSWPSEPGDPGDQTAASPEHGAGAYPADSYPADPYSGASGGHEQTYPADYGPPPSSPSEYGTPAPPHEFGHGSPQTELDPGYASPPTAYDPGTPVPVPPGDPGAAYGPPPEPWAGGLSAAPPPPPQDAPGEHTITLSPEPWASEPQVWTPPPPQEKKKSPPYLLIATGLVVLAAVALGIVFWPSGSGKADRAGSVSPQTTQQPQQTASQGRPPASPSDSPSSPSPSGDLAGQAGKVNALLDEMSSTRGELQTVLSGGCDTSPLQRIKGERQSQLATAQGLDVSAVDGGQQVKDALVRALEASVASNAKYIELSPGCPSDADVADVNQQATDAKSAFIALWNPVAAKANLASRSESSI